jgi:hypothetical protein
MGRVYRTAPRVPHPRSFRRCLIASHPKSAMHRDISSTKLAFEVPDRLRLNQKRIAKIRKFRAIHRDKNRFGLTETSRDFS